jgi:hypothetical protein
MDLLLASLIIGLLIGVVINLFSFKVFIIFPAILIVAPVASISIFTRTHDMWLAIGSGVIIAIFISVGYLIGVAVRFFLDNHSNSRGR